MLGQTGEIDLRRLAARRFQMGNAGERHQVAPAGFVLHQKCRPIGFFRPRMSPAVLTRVSAQRQFAAQNRLYTGFPARLGKLKRAEQIVPVGDRDGRHALSPAQPGKLIYLDRAFRKRISRMHMEMDKAGVAHGPDSQEIETDIDSTLWGKLSPRIRAVDPLLSFVPSKCRCRASHGGPCGPPNPDCGWR